MKEFPNQVPGQEKKQMEELPAEAESVMPPAPTEETVAPPQPSEADFAEQVATLEESLGVPLSDEAKNDIHKNMIGETPSESIPEAPMPTMEKEPHFLSLEEVQGKMNSLIDTRTGRREKPPRIEKRQDGLATLVEYEIRNDDGSVWLISYRAVGERSANTTIEIIRFRGEPDDGDYLDGFVLADYDEASGRWKDVPNSIALLAAAKKSTEPRKERLSEIHDVPLDTETKQQGEKIIEAVRSMEAEALYAAFDQAEAAFGTTSMEDTLFREGIDMKAAMEAREKTKPLMNKIYSEMIRLNKSEENYMSPLGQWNPDGDLTESQFNELNLRRKKLSNAVGILHKDASGRIAIRHDLDEI